MKKMELTPLDETITWKEMLYGLYLRNRESLGWHTLKSLHDEEDQAYFDMLDKMTGRNDGRN